MTSGAETTKDVATPEDAGLVITFGDFTAEEAVRALHLEEAKAAAEAAAPPKPMSWAAALGVKPAPAPALGVKPAPAPAPATPASDPAAPATSPPPPPPAWGNAAAAATAPSSGSVGTGAAASFVPLEFEDAMQTALSALDVTAPAKEMKKRGLVNQGNTCFQNAIMQSVLSCPPFLNLLMEISSSVEATPDLLAKSSSFRAWRHMLAFTREFEEPSLAQLQRLGGSGLNDIQRKVPKPIKITGYFMDVLSAFQKSRGEQEDALEFLEFFLDYLHLEYEQSGLQLPVTCEKQTKRVVANARAAGGFDDGSGDTSSTGASSASAALQTAFEMDDGWAEVGKGGKSSVLRQNPVDAARSPINWLFKGAIRAELRHGGKKQSSITIEPFHCLHLNLEHEPATIPGVPNMKAALKSYNVEDMIRRAFEVEVIEDSQRAAPMKRITTIDALPVVLTLNIKRFTYHPELGPVKLQQFVKYPASFAFPVDVLSSTCRAESGGGGIGGAPPLSAIAASSADDPSASPAGFTRYPPVYELFAVVSHLGKFVVGGHYTCMCKDNKDQWFRYDDEHVLSVNEANALAENAYLLFYMRTNNPVVNRPPLPPPGASNSIPGAGKAPGGNATWGKKQQQQQRGGGNRSGGGFHAGVHKKRTTATGGAK